MSNRFSPPHFDLLELNALRNALERTRPFTTLAAERLYDEVCVALAEEEEEQRLYTEELMGR
jgi:hypothetical protein